MPDAVIALMIVSVSLVLKSDMFLEGLSIVFAIVDLFATPGAEFGDTSLDQRGSLRFMPKKDYCMHKLWSGQ